MRVAAGFQKCYFPVAGAEVEIPETPEIANFLWMTRGIWISLKRNLI